jgi:hypothetical protein
MHTNNPCELLTATLAVGSGVLLGGWMLALELRATTLFDIFFVIPFLYIRNALLKARLQFLELRLEGRDFGFQRGHRMAACVYLWSCVYAHIFKYVNPPNKIVSHKIVVYHVSLKWFYA